MKKNFLFGLLAIGLASFGFGGISIAASCDGDFVAKNTVDNETCYGTLGEAIENAQSVDTVTLLKDIDTSVSISKNLTLDLNGHKINGTLTQTAGELIINDEGNNGGINSITVDGGELILNGGTYRAGVAVFVSGNGSKATINGGIYTAICGNTAAVYAYDDGVIDITGGEFYGETKTETEGNGGSCSGTEKQGKVFYGGAQGDGENRSNPGTVNVEGGTFDGRISASEGSIYHIAGGTFVGNTVAKTAECSEFNGGNNNQEGCTDTTIDAFLVEGYEAIESNSNYVVSIKKYSITWKNGETTLETDENVEYNSTPSYDGATPTKAADSSYTYSFKGWSKDGTAVITLADEKITGDVTYTALFNSTKKSSGGSSSGGGGSSKKTETTKTEDAKATTGDTAKVDDKKVDETKTDETKNDTDNEGSDGNKNPTEFSQEFKDAYEFAHKNGITTKDSIEDADMYGPLTRIAMAKMLSQYAINVLGKTPDTDKVVPNFPDVDAKLDADYDNGVTLAYQLGIMGIGVEEFRPFAEVTRAEFGTALSRMLFGTADGEGADWYKTHLDKLMNEQIITNDNPNLKELRGYVMIMLMRSAQ